MDTVTSEGVKIAYRVVGEGRPLVLIHGYTSSMRTNWDLPGWVDFLKGKRRLVLMDLRGHGRSEKPRDKDAYSVPLMARDVLTVMDAAGVEATDVFGYSMGGMVAMELLLNYPERFRAAIIGGMGAVWPASRKEHCREEESGPAPRLARDGRRTLAGLVTYIRQFDPRAKRAVYLSVFKGGQPVSISRLGEIKVPVLVVAGTRDSLCPGTRVLADRIRGARRVTLSGRGHIGAVSDPRFKEAVGAFLKEVARREPAGLVAGS